MSRVRLERKTDWHLKVADANDTEGIKSFLRKNIWSNRDTDIVYRWKYENNPAGNSLIIIGKNSEDKVIASNFFMPWRLSVNNSIINASQWVDLLVDRSYRGQPIPSKMLQQSLETSRNEGRPVCFAFPNNNAVPVHKKNNGIHLGLIYRYTKPLNVKYLIGRYIKSESLSRLISPFMNWALKLISKETYRSNRSYTIEKVDNCGEEFDVLWKQFSEVYNNKVFAQKNSAYLNWKYLNSPNKNRSIYSIKKKDKLEGFVVLETSQNIGYIVDVVALNEKAINSLIAYSIEHFRANKVESVVFVALENHIYVNALKQFGFVERPEPRHLYIYLDDNLQNREYFLSSNNWSITIGDCDIEGL